MVDAGTFRADLYYRLNVLPIRLPPLRERLGDLEALVETLSDDIARRSAMPHKSISGDALELLARHSWPGNIRELRNVLEQATLMTDDVVLGAGNFRGAVSPLTASAAPPAHLLNARAGLPRRFEAPLEDVSAVRRPLAALLSEVEHREIRTVLAESHGNIVQAARTLGISRSTLYSRIAKFPELLGGQSATA
jgi:transcriptional regulator with PAS, ATPase and Fis domain